MSRYPRRHPEVAFRPMGPDGGLVVLPVTSEVKVVNETGSTILSLLDGERSPEDIASVVAERFDVSAEQALADVRAFLDEAEQHGMIVAANGAGRNGGDA